MSINIIASDVYDNGIKITEENKSEDKVSTTNEVYEFNSHYYSIYIVEECTWIMANVFCEKEGGYLALITSAEEQAFREKINVEKAYSEIYESKRCDRFYD